MKIKIMSNSYEAEKIRDFERQEPIMEQIFRNGFEAYARTLKNLSEPFDLKKHRAGDNSERCICCMDEGTPFGIHAAGSGILLSEKEFDEYVKKVKPDAISSHDGCGAGKIYAQSNDLPIEESDEITKEWTKKMAQKYNLPHLHFAAGQMKRPEFHDARVCYYDNSGKFNYYGVEGLPKGFVISRYFLGEKNSLKEAAVAVDIIFGEHGLGNLLSEDKPFIIAAIGKNEKELEIFEAELLKLKHPYGAKIKIDGFIAPKSR